MAQDSTMSSCMDIVITQTREFKEYEAWLSKKIPNQKGDPKTNFVSIQNKKNEEGKSIGVPYYFNLLEEEELFNHLNRLMKIKYSFTWMEKQSCENQKLTGLYIDLDIENSVKKEIDERCLKNKIIKNLASHLFFDLDINEMFKIFILKKPEIVLKDGVYRDGLHILIPELHVPVGYKKFLFDKLKGLKFGNDLSDKGEVLDKGSASCPALIYGASRPGRKSFYDLYKVYDVRIEMNKENILRETKPSDLKDFIELRELEVDEYKRIDILSITNCYETTQTPKIRVEYKETDESLFHKYEFWVEENKEHYYDINEIAKIDIDFNYFDTPETKKIASVLDILEEYAENYHNWIEVLICLKNNYDFDESINFALAVYFSRKCSQKYDPEVLVEKWNSFKDSSKTIRSLFWNAKKVNGKKLIEINSEYSDDYLKQTINENFGKISPYHTGIILYNLIGNFYFTDSSRNWYEFMTPQTRCLEGEEWKWKMSNPKQPLKFRIPDSFSKYVSEDFCKRLTTSIQLVEDELSILDGEENEEIVKNKKNLKQNLKNSRYHLQETTFKNKIYEESTRIFANHLFASKMDENSLLLPVANGIIKLGKEIKLIEGKHDELVSRFTPVIYQKFDPYLEEDNEFNDYCKYVLNYYESKYPEEDMRIWKLFHDSLSLQGGIKEPIIYFEKGIGSNGKTSMMESIQKMLGTYAKKCNGNLIIKERESGPDSSLSSIKGKRYGFIEEFKQGERINTARLKEITGGQIDCRDLYEKQNVFQSEMYLSCGTNHDPIIEEIDDGTTRRVKYYECKISFKKDPQTIYEKKADERYRYNFPNDPKYHQALLSILVYFNEKLHQNFEGLLSNIDSPTLQMETDEYFDRIDKLGQFYKMRLVKSKGNNMRMDELIDYTLSYFSRKDRLSYEKIEAYLNSSFMSKFIDIHHITGAKYFKNLRFLKSNETMYDYEDYIYHKHKKTKIDGEVRPFWWLNL